MTLQKDTAVPTAPSKACVNNTALVWNELNVFAEQVTVLGKYLQDKEQETRSRRSTALLAASYRPALSR